MQVIFYRWTLLLNFCVVIIASVHSQSKGISRGKVEAKINDFKLRLGKSLEKSTVFWNSFVEGRSTKLVPVITSRHIGLQYPAIPTLGYTVKVAGFEIPFFLTANNTLSMLNKFIITPISQFSRTRHFLSIQGFGFGSEVWFISHISENNKHYIELHKFDGYSVVLGQRIELPGTSIVSSTDAAQTVFIAVATTNTKFSEFKLLRWSGTQFREILSTRIHDNCSALAIWEMEGSMFVALGFSETRHLTVNRVVENSEQMHTFQLLGVEVYVIKHFSHVGSHYLVFGTRDCVMIYWWSGSAFVIDYIQQFYNTVTDVTIHRLSGKVVVAVIFHDEIKFVVQNPSARYSLAGSIYVKPTSTLKTVLLWRKEKRLYMLPIFKGNQLTSAYEIDLKFKVTDIQRGPELKKCLDSLFTHVSERQKKLDKMLSRAKNVWSSNEELKVRSLKVNGMIKSSAKSRVGSLLLTGVSFPFTMLKMPKEMAEVGERLRKELKRTVFKSTVQIIETRFKFKNLTVVKGAIIGLEDGVNLNNVNTARLPFTLKKRAHQTFQFYTNVSHVLCGMARTRTINRNRIEDYLLLNSESMNVTGRFKFSNVSVKTLLIESNLINGINADNFVTVSKTQDVRGTKIFERLSAGTILAEKRVGEIYEIQKRVADMDSKSFRPSLNFTPVLIIRGNLNIKTLNGFNIMDLYSKSVRRDEKQDIRGKKTFKSISINRNVYISGLINNCAINNLMTLKTDQIINGTVTFNDIAFFQTVLTDNLNGIDLSEQAVVRFRYNIIEGLKTFRQNLTVSYIIMKEGILLDKFDPSDEMSGMIYKSTTNFPDVYRFNKGVTIDNIVAENLKLTAGSFPLLDNLENVWLKTTEQNIPSLEATHIRMRNNLEVSRVNGVDMKNLVTVNGNVQVDELKFKDDVLFKTLTLSEGSILKFFSKLSDPNVEVKIMNNIMLESAVFESNISVDGFVNGLKTDFIYTEKLQTLKDEFEFQRIELKELRSKDLKFELINKINFTDYFEQSVVPFKNRSISNKHFKTLKGTALMSNGILNNISLDRVATTNTKQKIVSSWNFTRDISFSTVNVKSFFDEIRLEDVFYNDEVGSISNKHFNGNVTTTQVNTRGYVNNVNVTHLQLKAFNKNRRNVVKKRIKFHSNLTAEEIQAESKVDNVDFKDLIRLNESVKLERLNAASIAAMNTNVKGLVNGCPWTSLHRNILSLSKFSGNVTSRIDVKSLVIDGNLNLEYLNGASIPDSILLLEFMEASDINANVTFENLKAENVQILKVVNNASIAFLVNDAVRKTVSQVGMLLVLSGLIHVGCK